jgi:uncharacterized phage protein gp47/JayE
MPVEADVIYRTREQIVNDAMQRMQARIPDIWTSDDGMFRLFYEVLGEILEGVYLANQILRDNIFIQSANLVELRRHGEEYGLAIKAGAVATGSLRFSGAGGTVLDMGSEVSAEPVAGQPLYYVTTAPATIPDPGVPTAPTAADSGSAGNPVAGTYEYVITFVTAGGETAQGASSTPLTIGAAHQINLTAIPLGGPGTTQRKIYRQRDGGGYRFVAALANNTATTYTDNILEASLGAAPPVDSTAESVVVTAEAEEAGAAYNALVGTITGLADITDGVTDVTNTTAFIGGADEEDMEEFRDRLLSFVRSPHTGSKSDLELWAEEITGVEDATTFVNDNLGVVTAGHATTRVSGPNGSIPTAAVLDAVLANQQAKDIANITLHVATFTQLATNVTVDVTEAVGYTLAEITANVQQAIIDYINSVPVGGTVYVAGIVDAVFGLPGVANVAVTTPATDQTATNTQKRVAGTVSVT